MKVKLHRQWWRIGTGRDSDDPNIFAYTVFGKTEKTRRIKISPDLEDDSQQLLATLNHEVLHVLFPFLAEEEIARSAYELTEVLWSLGARIRRPK